MREGKNREIRNVLRELGLQVNRLIRISYGPFQLGELPAGAIEEVTTRILRDQLGERLAAQAGADFSAPIMEREALEPVITAREIAPLPSRTDGEGQRDHRRETNRGGAACTCKALSIPDPSPPLAARAGGGEPRQPSGA